MKTFILFGVFLLFIAKISAFVNAPGKCAITKVDPHARSMEGCWPVRERNTLTSTTVTRCDSQCYAKNRYQGFTLTSSGITVSTGQTSSRKWLFDFIDGKRNIFEVYPEDEPTDVYRLTVLRLDNNAYSTFICRQNSDNNDSAWVLRSKKPLSQRQIEYYKSEAVDMGVPQRNIDAVLSISQEGCSSGY